MAKFSAPITPAKAFSVWTEKRLSEKLLNWYDANRRAFPWRYGEGEVADPYRVWLSEVMLQQTTTTAVVPYFEKFVKRWPHVRALAGATIEEVMQAWAGLGYYSRARNLHACAKAVAGRQGQFPRSEAELRDLPGIGPYTAAAVVAIAFDQRAVVVDGNVERVVSRLFAIETPLPASRPEIRIAADMLTPAQRCGDFAQAMMDLGAGLCQPKRTDCPACPLHHDCKAAAVGRPLEFPRRLARKARPHRKGLVYVITDPNGAVLARTRPPKGLLGGTTELPTTEWHVDFDAENAWTPLTLEFSPSLFSPVTATVEHVFTHFSLELEIFSAKLPVERAAPEGYRWVPADGLALEAWSSLMQKVLEKVRKDDG